MKTRGNKIIEGKTTTETLKVTTGAVSGYVLTSDVNGDATWQASSGGVASVTGTTNRITITGTTTPAVDIAATYVGQTSLTTLGTITTGTWTGTAIAVANGGTGRATATTAYGLIAAGTTATGAHQTLAAGLTTQILVGGGASALPVWTTATGTGAPVRAGSPTFTTTLTTPAINVSGSTATTLAMFDASKNLVPVTLTTTGTSGAATLTGTTLNIPQYTGGSTYTGTLNRISVTGTVIDIDAAYVGQSTITTLGTIATGVWDGTAIALNKITALTASRAVVSDASGFLASATTTATELGYLSGVTSAIQTQINNKMFNYTISTGLSIAGFGSTIVANTAVGVAGGQTIIGSTSTTSGMTYKSTSGIGTTGADHIFQVGNNGATEAMRILNSGNVAIGTTSSSVKLTVSGTTNTGELTVTTSSANSSIAIASLLSPNATGDSYFLLGRALSTYNSALVGLSSTGSATNYAFMTLYGRSASDFTIHTDGSIGIGTVTPAVLGTGTLTGKTFAVVNSGSPARITVRGTAAGVLFDSSAGAADQKIFQMQANSGTFSIAKVLDDLTGSTERFTILPSGFTGINNSSPKTSLDVIGLSVTAPSLSLYKGIFSVTGSNTAVLETGSYENAPYQMYMQTKDSGLSGNSYPLLINPLGGNVGVGVVVPTAAFHLKAGTATASSAPLKLTAGTALTTPEAGAFEFSSSESGLTFTAVSTRKAIAYRNPIIATTASSATPTATATEDILTVTALAANATFGAPTGTWTDGQEHIIRVKDNATPRTLAFNAAYRFSTDLAAPTTTVASKTLYMKFKYNSADSKHDCVATLNNF